jgi:hypothetical protein
MSDALAAQPELARQRTNANPIMMMTLRFMAKPPS